MFKPEDMLNLSSDNSSFCAIKLSPEEAAYMNYREKELLLLGINIYDFDSSHNKTTNKKYQRYCDLAIKYLDNRQPVPAEIRDYLLKVKAQREKLNK